MCHAMRIVCFSMRPESKKKKGGRVVSKEPHPVEHTLTCWAVPVVTKLEAKCPARLTVKPNDNFHIDMILRWTPASAYIMYT
jgi:hypothetical protein